MELANQVKTAPTNTKELIEVETTEMETRPGPDVPCRDCQEASLPNNEHQLWKTNPPTFLQLKMI